MTMDGTISLADKRYLFKKLETPTDDALSLEEISLRRDCDDFFKPKPKRPSPPTSARAAPHTTPRRVSSAPQALKQGDASKVIQNTPASAYARKGVLHSLLQGTESDDTAIAIPASIHRLQRSETAPLPLPKRMTSEYETETPTVTKRRRRKDNDVPPRPESEQIFQDLVFYYVPNNDIAPARRMRMAKAKACGATRTEFASGATHFIVDKALTFQDVEAHRATATRGVAVVNEDWPLDCMQFRTILDVGQKKYLLRGQPDALPPAGEAAAPPTSSGESARSLQLKPPQRNPKKWDYVPPRGTPGRSEESSLEAGPRGGESQPVVLDLGAMVEPTATHVESSTPLQDAKGDELSSVIDLMQEYRELPLDAEEHDDEDARSNAGTVEDISSADEEAGSEGERSRTAPRPTLRGKKMRFEERFACNQATAQDARPDNPNARTMEVLQQMASYYDRINDNWRTIAYRKAISTLKRQDVRITTEQEALRLPGVGPRLAQKIEEIVTTDRLRRLEYAEDDPMGKVLQLFMGIYGVGNKQAQQWIAQGFRTLDDLKRDARLSANQLIGIERYDDLQQRIPRHEVEALGSIVKKTAAGIDAAVEIIIGGSYRRGSQTSGDIDIVVTKPGTEVSGDLVPFLDTLTRTLEARGFLVACLASSRSAEGSKWHGCCVLPSSSSSSTEQRHPWRRIDFLLVPETELGAALLYFTGNDIFNRSMRLLASRKGMRLNQRGLYRNVLRGAAGARVTEGELVEGRDERRIFELLGVQWREPHERWC
ncbi:uncharacterized protein F5Z01DRAFT_668554 [Emericellopsis atlantica]|uniref:DNA polymerase lambda n=1 Tax=Emericellopsis atlantica TaxID=2614577 RepID=A0A9P8CK39_9HYPO|nr:uncharacterized protein F5Z01DRAFT_668554 [Emericellopsis atlantica]KAG9249657.1 hypothetical protein F5Z01DRAFT_668554 [Emericellopsis atlantica]